MAVDFCDYFWGEKHDGFQVLYHNLKAGFMATKDLSDVIRETALIQENSYKVNIIYFKSKLFVLHLFELQLILSFSVLCKDKQATWQFCTAWNIQSNVTSSQDSLW